MTTEAGARERSPSEVRLPGSLVRCPFCHDDLVPEVEVWTACARCLARHHAACWRDAARCATCGHHDGLGASRMIVVRSRWRSLRPWLAPLVVALIVVGYALQVRRERATIVGRFDGYVRQSFEEGLEAGRARQTVRLPLGLELVQAGHDWLVVRRMGKAVEAAVLGVGADPLTSIDGDVVVTTDQDGRTWRAPLTRGRVYVVGRYGEMSVAPVWPADVGRWLEEAPGGALDLRALKAALLERKGPRETE